MSKVFVIPDIHLKPWMLDRAEELISKKEYDYIISLGDVVDDWGNEFNLPLYVETLEALATFARRHPNFKYCYGNHDISYVWTALQSGYSGTARNTVLDGLDKLKSVMPASEMAFIHRIDNALFSHAGLTEAFVDRYLPKQKGDLDSVIGEINTFGREEMWCDVSPIWARPQEGTLKMYPDGFLQVVGHTPVRHTDFYKNILTVDNFSTYRDGKPIGDQRFVWVNTVTMQWGFADKDGEVEPMPDARLDIRNYKVGEVVRFAAKKFGSDKEEMHEGTVEIIDRYPFDIALIDILSDGVLYKHVPLEKVIEKNGDDN